MRLFLNLFVGIVGIAAATAQFVQPAAAAVFTLDFDEPGIVLSMPAADGTTGTVNEGLVGSDTVDYLYRSPWEGTSNPGATFTAVQARSSASYLLDAPVTGVSFLWGSVDFYNTVIFKNGGVVIDYLIGQSVLDAGAPAGEDFVQISILALAAFDEIIFDSTQNAFEFANIVVTAVPLPAALPLYGAGLVVLGWVSRKRKRSQQGKAA